MAPGLNDDEHWAAVSRATQLQAICRTPRAGLRLRAAGWLVRTGLRLAEPLTVERLVGTG